MTALNNILIEARNISKSFAGVTALDDVSIQVRAGERVGLVGSNGSGKTTLLNVLSRFVDIDAGDILLEGKTYRNSDPANLATRGVVRTFQYTKNWINMDVRENLLVDVGNSWPERLIQSLFAWKRIRNHESALWRDAGSMLERFGIHLDELLDNQGGLKLVKDISLGQRRIVELVRAFLMKPKVLLLDEPSVGLDEHAYSFLEDYLERLASAGSAILLVSHDKQFVGKNVNRMIIMHEGRKLLEEQARNFRFGNTTRTSEYGTH